MSMHIWLKVLVRKYMVAECDVKVPTDAEVEEQILEGVKVYGSESKLMGVLEDYLGLWS